jgi:hypothetical protein
MQIVAKAPMSRTIAPAVDTPCAPVNLKAKV